jgi:hypothetical protein
MEEALRATRRVRKMSALMIIHDELLQKVSKQVDTMPRYPPNFEIKERYVFCSSAFLSWPEPSQGQIRDDLGNLFFLFLALPQYLF